MKKISTLLMMLFAFVGFANAEVTKYYKPGERLSEITAGQKVMFYNTCLPDGQDRTGFLTDNGSSLNLDKSKPFRSPIFSEKVGVWTIESATPNGSIYTVNIKGSNGYLGIGGKTNNAQAQTLLFHEWTTADGSKKAGVDSENAEGTKVNNADISTSDKVWLVTNANQSNTWNGNQASFATWSTGHPYAIYSVVEATTAELETLLATAKTNAVTELNALKNLPSIFTNLDAKITEVNDVTLANDDLETALNTIKTLVATVKAEANGKNVKFCNKATDGRGGNYLGYDKTNNRAAAVADGGDAVIWTIKLNADGTFKLYNWVNNVYLGTPADPTPVVADEASAPSFRFISTAENEVALATGDKMVHIANHSDYKVIHHWSTSDKASLWNVTVVPEIVVSRDQYNAAAAAKATLPYGIQQAYGLVTDASKYYSNWKSTAEGSYEALLDNTVSSYFHSAYTDEAKAESAETHYIQADLGEGKSVDQFYFYMLPRSGNGNNRPKNITIYGSNDINGEFTKITDVITTLDGSMNPYMSAKIGTQGTNYRYIRFTVTSTNTNTKFFTLSELYILPASVEDVTTLVEAYNNFATTSITSNDFATYANALINGETTLALSNIKKEVKSILDANVSNHNATPALGQYTTEAYNALNAAYNAADATQESLETAIVAFKKSLNAPVYVISGLYDYAQGKAIYYNGSNPEWRWDTKNVYNKAMWFKVLGLTSSEFALNTDYNVVNYNGLNICNHASIKFHSIENWDGAYNLQFGSADYEYIHAANHSNNLVTYWNAATTDNNQASAWKVEYIGNSYDLDKLPESLFTAAAELVAVSVPNFTFSEGMNSYDPATKPVLDAAIANRTTVLSKLSTADEIAAAKTQLETAINGVNLNMPKAGKFYRVRCSSTGMKRLQSTINNDRLQMISGDEGINANSIFCYINGSLLSYTKGQYINAYAFDAVGTNSTVAFSKAYNGTLGQYNIKINNDRYIYGEKNEIDSGTGNPTDAGYNWWLEEVTSLPVSISAAGYATFYAPVALTLPAELTAYTVSVNGEWATLNTIEGNVIPANTGVVLGGANGEKASEGTYNLTVTESAETISGNKLLGSVAASYVTAEAYVLGYINVAEEGQPEDKQVGFYTATKNFNEAGEKVAEGGVKWLNNGFKAYLPKTAGANALRFNFGGETTAIESVLNNGVDANAPIYDLSGRRVMNAVKGGIYIQNGKKFIVK